MSIHALVERTRQDRIAARARITESLRAGSIWTSPRARYWAIVLLDPEEPGRWRMQTFDRQGFTGHTARDTMSLVGEVLIQEFGCDVHVCPASLLDEVAQGWPQSGEARQ